MFRGARSLDDVKGVAQTFIQFLEEKNLKQDMLESELRSIYQSQFRLEYSISVSFSRVFNALKYHLNKCQKIQDRVIFGGGEAAALKMLSIDDSEESSSEEDEKPGCKICKRTFTGDDVYDSHLNTVSHRQQSIFKKIRKSVER